MTKPKYKRIKNMVSNFSFNQEISLCLKLVFIFKDDAQSRKSSTKPIKLGKLWAAQHIWHNYNRKKNNKKPRSPNLNKEA